jgi:hypothetical protein
VRLVSRPARDRKRGISSRVARDSTLSKDSLRPPAFRFALCNTVQGCLPAHRKTAKKMPTAANLRSWRVIIIRSRGEYLGSIEAARSREGWRPWPSSSALDNAAGSDPGAAVRSPRA